MQLLIVDDSPVFRKQLEFTTIKSGFSPILFESGIPLWDYLSQGVSEELLILLDWEMPGLDGPTLCRKIRERFPDHPIHIILVTGRDETQSLVEGLSAGADDYVTKPVNADELEARFSVGIRNLALRRRIHELNEQRLIAERLVTVAQLASGAAHEINNPLAFIKSNLDLISQFAPQLIELLNQLEDPSSSLDSIKHYAKSKQLNYLAEDLEAMAVESLTGVARVQSIVEGLLRFNAEQGLHNTLVNFSELVADVTADAHHSDVEPNLLIEGDVGQLTQLVLAIFENAQQAITQGGQVSVSLKRHQRELQLKIKDSGVGISTTIKHRVFDPFFTTRAIGQGVGLGLSLALGIAKRHSGTITFHSSEGIGTTFLFACPVVNDAP